MPSKHHNGGAWITKKCRTAIILRDNFTCLYCLRNLHDADPKDITLDHIVCKSDGGTNESNNLVCACRSCNSSRGDKPLRRFAGRETIAHIRRQLRRSMTKYLALAKAMLDDDKFPTVD